MNQPDAGQNSGADEVRDVTSFTIDDLRSDELDALRWSGSAAHLENVAHQLDRRASGVVEYLVVRNAVGAPIAKGAIDYEETPGAGTIFQLATRQDLEGRGLATRLLAAAERKIAARGLLVVRLAVEPENQRAVRLYEHQGYQVVGEREGGWEREAPGGGREFYRTRLLDMEKLIDPN